MMAAEPAMGRAGEASSREVKTEIEAEMTAKSGEGARDRIRAIRARLCAWGAGGVRVRAA